MRSPIAAYGACLLVLLTIDAVWLGVVARPLYEQGIGHLMAPAPNLAAAAAFYLLYPVGLLVFAVLPALSATPVRQAAGRAALFGLVAYGTYDLTNLATLRDWPLGLALLDMAWGSAVSAVAAAAGRWLLGRRG